MVPRKRLAKLKLQIVMKCISDLQIDYLASEGCDRGTRPSLELAQKWSQT